MRPVAGLVLYSREISPLGERKLQFKLESPVRWRVGAIKTLSQRVGEVSVRGPGLIPATYLYLCGRQVQRVVRVIVLILVGGGHRAASTHTHTHTHTHSRGAGVTHRNSST